MWDWDLFHVCFQLVIGLCDGTEHDVIIFGHDVINFGHKNYYKVDHGRVQCRGNVRSSGTKKYQWVDHTGSLRASNHIQKLGRSFRAEF